MKQLETDYLVIGTGAMGMAFVDTMLDETDASFIMVDRHHLPGGHWNDAYSFVRLHQPSAFYGVASSELGSMSIDRAGSNRGLYELAGGPEVIAYFERVMRERFLASGRVQYFPMCDYVGDGQFRSMLSDSTFNVSVQRKTVDTTFYRTSVPSTHTRKFKVDEDIVCVPPNRLPRQASAHESFVILGAGKTAMDACVWLLDAGADPDRITWVVPRDSWLMNRHTVQPGTAFFEQTVGGFNRQLEAMIDATSINDVFIRLEQAGFLLRVDRNVWPEMFHYATISEGEVEQLQRIGNVIRQGRVAKVSANGLVMEDGGSVATQAEALYVDCTATAVKFTGKKSQPVFSDDHITLQAVLAPLVTTSAAIIAFVEANFEDDSTKNQLCTPIDLSDTPTGWLPAFLKNMRNQVIWTQNGKVRNWLADCRLSPTRRMPDDAEHLSPSMGAVKQKIDANVEPALQNLHRLIQSVDPTDLR